ncbi:hypothetical protein HU200_014411 [Digitaria exilis]|uniref:Uncharacterized protein n=1 Tax=Digitaria exilis TaxID=1010633 RepID=A0A835FC18_9POAL|nr:hypothetical protein HU200_014411 [Digitaria exilis]
MKIYIVEKFALPFSPIISTLLFFVGICYRRRKKSAESNISVFTPGVATYSSGHALPVTNEVPSPEFGSASKEWDTIQKRTVQMMSLLSSWERQTENSVIAGKMAGCKLNEPTEQKAAGNHLFSLRELCCRKGLRSNVCKRLRYVTFNSSLLTVFQLLISYFSF